MLNPDRELAASRQMRARAQAIKGAGGVLAGISQGKLAKHV